MEHQDKLLKDYSDVEKGAYLGAIASLATADHAATEEEITYLQALAESAGLSGEQQEAVTRAAKELSGDELKQCLDIIKGSDLRFSFMADMISFAEADQSYTEEEKRHVEKIAQQLNIDQNQFSLLNQFVKKGAETGQSGEAVATPGFLSSLGLEDKFKSAGIDMGSLTKGLLGIAGPMVLAGLVSRSLGRGRRFGNNPFGSRGYAGQGSGFGSLISILNGGRGFRSTGGLLSRIFGSRY